MSSRVRRRDVVRALPVVVMGSALGGLGRLLAACTSEEPARLDGRGNPYQPVPPTDDDEFVPPTGNTPPPVDTGDTPPTVPNQVWEARARQLEDEQARVYGPVFTMTAPGSMAGKERSHTPVATKLEEAGQKKVVVLVQHVMGANGLDAGYVDSGAPDARPADAAADAADARPADAAADAARPPDAAALPVHYITTIYVRAVVDGKDTVVGLWEFQSTDPAPPSVKFTMPAGVTSAVAYEWCTLHGLWKADPLAI